MQAEGGTHFVVADTYGYHLGATVDNFFGVRQEGFGAVGKILVDSILFVSGRASHSCPGFMFQSYVKNF